MGMLNDRRNVMLLGGAALALMLGVIIAITIMSGDKGSDAPPPASMGGLVVQTGRDDDTKLDASRPIRCFVAGQFVGEMTLSDCAQRNGVATGALDVGVDETGALAAADSAGTILTPLPPRETAQPSLPAVVVDSAQPAPTQAAGSSCLRYAGGGWSAVGSMDLNACVQTLFSGQCEKRGGATYGRWGDQTLRLVQDKVEISSDNRRFRTLVDQGANCSIPTVG